jgi:arsenate reductase
MAEGFANYYGNGLLVASSAGMYPAGIIMANTVVAMQEKGIDISHQTSKGLSAVNLKLMDWVIILEASLATAIEVSPSRTRQLNWFVPDPVGQPIEAYRQVRDQLELKVLDFIETIRNET